ncbi:GNAT family N-acetyltransferase [Allobacillus sp. GCM10007491]|uniref:GNAT family N-acetyltransferase n=1 Tax=Allobacillus saliphilus TaxID=2912308 RepID=A0A941CV33_9BACI|nr:GNAT family N-acetyltransferase [Allobacillus saliphilus]MBR7553656.1 GNAT family N-acetyltransferase [Allobacillus saliphilus]
MTTIRLMEEKDIPSVQHVAHMSWHDTYEGIIPKKVRNVFLEKAYNKPMLEKKLENSIIFVATDEENVIGYAHFTPVDENGDSLLAAIYLLPSVQNKGVGSKLLEEGIKQLNGIRTITLEVEEENEAAKRFYKRKEFIEVEKYVEQFFDYDLHTIRMRKYL